MKQFNEISDEELAAYLEGMLSDLDTEKVDNAMDIDTIEVLSVSRQAMNEFHKGNMVELPSWKNVTAASASIHPLYEPLAMAGFLGDSNSDGENEENIETDI